MQDYSDTESESEPELPINTTADECTNFSSHPCQDDPLLALQKIKQFDLTAIQRASPALLSNRCPSDSLQDSSLHDGILQASTSIIVFLDVSCALPLKPDDRDRALSYFPHLVDPAFLSILFDHRKISKSIAARTINNTALTPTVVCWVDVLLAKLSIVAMTIASGFSPTILDHWFKYMRTQREQDCVRAATQLPDQWQSIPSVLASPTQSRAAIRLALRLLFAVHIMRPQLLNSQSWHDPKFRPELIMSMTLSWANHLTKSFLAVSPASGYDGEERTSSAMILSLYSASHISRERIQTDGPPSPMRIQGLGHLLYLVQFILTGGVRDSDRPILPYQHLDMAQTILVRWGEVVPWCWKTWNDQRTANIECIADLTILWLYHLNSPFCISECLQPFRVRLDLLLTSNNEVYSSVAIVQALHQAMSYLNNPCYEGASSWLATVLRKLCGASIQIVASNVRPCDSPITGQIVSLCHCLICLFCMVGHSEQDLNIKELIIECLVLVAPQELRQIFYSVRQDTGIQFESKLDQGIVDIERQIHRLRGTPFAGASATALLPRSVKCTLDYLTIIWHSEAEDLVVPETLSSFLITLINLLPRHRFDSCPSSMICEALLTALSAMERCPVPTIGKFAGDGFLYDLAVQPGCTSNIFIAASAFAHYLMKTKRTSDSLRYVEAWSYLQDVLFLILGRQLPEADEALALLVCPMISLGLMKILQLSSVCSDFILSSPWTMTLRSELMSLMSPGNPQTVPYFATLRQRLSGVGAALLDQITSEQISVPDLEEILGAKARLLFCYTPECSRLFLAF